MEELRTYHSSSKKTAFCIISAVLLVILFYFLFLSPPSNFPVGNIVSIEPGMSLRSVSLELKNAHIIRSRTIFEAFMILYSGEGHLVSSDYLFEKSLPVFEIARRMEKGESHLAPVKVVIPEGFDNVQIAGAFSMKLTLFDKNKFLSIAKEGYLFPDTYFFFTKSDETDVIKSMSDNFVKKLTPLMPEISAQSKNENDIITMASIIEREAKGNTGDERAIISGILWKRITLGMPLQVDSAPKTYKVQGLPQNPICNPGLESIKAAIHPETSSFLYYLHDKIGNIHYARTFAEHEANRLKYLK